MHPVISLSTQTERRVTCSSHRRREQMNAVVSLTGVGPSVFYVVLKVSVVTTYTQSDKSHQHNNTYTLWYVENT